MTDNLPKFRPVPDEVMRTANVWAMHHGCRDITSCGHTPLAAFEAGVAAERERCAASLIGYRIGGQIYHPEDVTIVYREQP